MAASIGCNWRLRNLHGFILCLRLTTSLREATDAQRTGNFADCEGTRPPAPTFPANLKRESSSWSRSQTQVGECEAAPRRRLFCLSPLAPPEAGCRRVPQGFVLSHRCGFYFWPQEQRSILFSGSFTLRMTHYSEI